MLREIVFRRVTRFCGRIPQISQAFNICHGHTLTVKIGCTHLHITACQSITESFVGFKLVLLFLYILTAHIEPVVTRREEAAGKQ